jgi:hypothetical protein
MAPPLKAISSILQHAPLKAAEHLPGVNLLVDDPTVKTEEFNGTDGQTDVFVFDAGSPTTNVALLTNFDAGEDLLYFRNMENRDLTVGDLGEGQGSHFVLFHGNGESANIVALGVPYQQDIIDEMILPFNGMLVFDDPFGVI